MFISTILSLLIVTFGQLFNLAYTYTALNFLDPQDVNIFNKSESVILIFISFVSIGIIQKASREIAINGKEWKDIFLNAQSLRISVSLLIIFLSFILYFITSNIFFTFSIISLFASFSGQYVLYALNKPILGSIISLIRTSIFSICIIIIILKNNLSFQPALILGIWVVSEIISGFICSKFLHVKYFYIPKKINISLNFFKVSFKLAIAIFYFDAFKHIIIFFGSLHFTNSDYIHYYECFKLYFLLFFLRRLIAQANYKFIAINKNFLDVTKINLFLITFAIIFLWTLSFLISYFKINFFPNFLTYDILKDVTIMGLLLCVFPMSFTKLISMKDNDKYLNLILIFHLLILSISLVIFGILKLNASFYLYLICFLDFLKGLISYLVNKKYF